MKNQDVRQKAQDAGVRLWELAELFHITDGNFSRKLRKELTEEEKKICFDFIEQRRKEIASGCAQ